MNYTQLLLSAPAFSLDVMPNIRKVELELISDADMFLLFEKSKRSRMSFRCTNPSSNEISEELHLSRSRTSYDLSQINSQLRWWSRLLTSILFLVNHNYLNLSVASFARCLPSELISGCMKKILLIFYPFFFLKIYFFFSHT